MNSQGEENREGNLPSDCRSCGRITGSRVYIQTSAAGSCGLCPSCSSAMETYILANNQVSAFNPVAASQVAAPAARHVTNVPLFEYVPAGGVVQLLVELT